MKNVINKRRKFAIVKLTDNQRAITDLIQENVSLLEALEIVKSNAGVFYTPQELVNTLLEVR